MQSEDDVERLVRRIETTRGESLWLRLPAFVAPLDISGIDFLVQKMRFALDPALLSPVFEDDAAMLLFPRDAIAVMTASAGKERRAQVLRFAESAVQVSHEVNFVDLRQPESLRLFMSGATEPRGFNDMAVDRGVFVKTSADIRKMKAEHDYFGLASPAMRRFLLPPFDYSEGNGVASYKMEHLQVPDAALQFVLGSFSESQFEWLLDRFFAFIACRDRDVIGQKAVAAAGREQILVKMHRRLETFLGTPEGARVSSILVSGGIPEGLEGLQRRAAPLIEAALARHSSDHLAFSHGDPCFSNILFDHRIGLIRLIDPRGATTRAEALLHPLYDVAKFSHSVCGGYDFVNNALFSIEVNSGLGLELRLHRSGAPGWVKDAFRARLAAEGFDYSEVRAVEASLFLSMLPLHLDHPRKLLGFSLIAREILDELEGIS